MSQILTKEERSCLLEEAIEDLASEFKDMHRSDINEMPDSVFVYVRELPRELRQFAFQAAYIGFLAGKTATRMHLIETFLAAAGAEIQAFPKDKNGFN